MQFWSALILGFLGSLHCAGMCGPLALSLPNTSASAPGFVVGRLAYNLGRILTYCSLGLVFGLVGRTFALAGIQRWVSIGLGLALFAGLFFSSKLARWAPVTGLVQVLKTRMSFLLRRRSFISLTVLGVLNGLLPCGLVYVACAGAIATGSLLAGTQFMAAFGLGTVPMMLGIGLSGGLLPVSLRLHLRKAIPLSVFLLASLLVLRGLSLGIPYLSPRLSTGIFSCCVK